MGEQLKFKFKTDEEVTDAHVKNLQEFTANALRGLKKEVNGKSIIIRKNEKPLKPKGDNNGNNSNT